MSESIFTYGAPGLKFGEGASDEIGYDLQLPEGTETLDVHGLRVYPGLVALGASSRINSDGGVLTLGGNISGAGRTLTVGGAGSTTINGVIGTTTGGLVKDGGATLVLGAANTYTGGTAINGGTIQLAGANGPDVRPGTVSLTHLIHGYTPGVLRCCGVTVLRCGSRTQHRNTARPIPRYFHFPVARQRTERKRETAIQVR